MSLQRAQERCRQLRSTGRVEIPESLRHQALVLLGCLAFTAIGVAGLIARWSDLGSVGRMLTDAAVWMSLLAVGFFGVVGIPALLVQMRLRSSLVLPWDGIEEHRDNFGQRLQTSSLSWSDIEAVTGQYVGGRWPSKGAYTVFLHLRPEAYRRYHEGLSPMARRLEKANSRLFGAGSVALRRFQGGSKLLEQLLQRAHRDFGADPTTRRMT